MKFSARKARRKWPFGGFGHGTAAIIAVAAVTSVLGLTGQPAAAVPQAGAQLPELAGALPRQRQAKVGYARLRYSVPLPKPRPEEAPAAELEQPAEENRAPAESTPGADQVPPAPLSACRQALSEKIAIAPSIPDIRRADGCGGVDLVRLEAVVLPDGRLVAVKPAALLRCTMASAVADWIRTDMAALAASLGTVIADLDNYDSYDCRSRNRVAGAPLSEHARANALDVRALLLANGQSIALTDRTVPHALRERVRQSVCTRFSTVLGPGSDGYHEEHIHLDLMERRNNYKICNWNVWDPLPQIAPLLPPERPAAAPPREDATAKPDAE